jgi:hypothetical protein
MRRLITFVPIIQHGTVRRKQTRAWHSPGGAKHLRERRLLCGYAVREYWIHEGFPAKPWP